VEVFITENQTTTPLPPQTAAQIQQITIARVCVQPDCESGWFDARITAGSRIRLCASWQIVIY
jgi:hypothetical protein